MIPAIVAGIAGLAAFVGITLFEKDAVAKGKIAPPGGAAPGGAPVLPPGVDPNLPPMPSFDIFPAKPFPGRPPPITVAERAAIVAKPPGTLTVQDVANLTVDFTPEQNAVLEKVGTPGLFSLKEAGPLDKSEAIRQGISVEELMKRSGGPLALPRATVTTNDPPPSGDLIIREAPSGSARQIGGANKDFTVTVVNMNASTDFAEIAFSGSPQYPGSRGFARKKFLVLL